MRKNDTPVKPNLTLEFILENNAPDLTLECSLETNAASICKNDATVKLI